MPDKKVKLLIVDDEASIVDYLERIFQKRGFETFGAKNGQDALQVFEDKKPEICLIDVFMVESDYNGIELLAKIKEKAPQAICIMVTRITSPETIKQAEELGAFHYLMKPLTLEDLQKTMQAAVSELEKSSNG